MWRGSSSTTTNKKHADEVCSIGLIEAGALMKVIAIPLYLFFN